MAQHAASPPAPLQVVTAATAAPHGIRVVPEGSLTPLTPQGSKKAFSLLS